MGARGACRRISLLLLPAVVMGRLWAGPIFAIVAFVPEERAPQANFTPYLTVLESPGLRFQSAPLPPRHSKRPVAVTAISAVVPPGGGPADDPALKPTAPDATDDSDAAREAKLAISAKPTPAPILRDHSSSIVRPEDFLPFFQIPGSNGRSVDVNVIGPIPPPANPTAIPPSSATYIQTDK